MVVVEEPGRCLARASVKVSVLVGTDMYRSGFPLMVEAFEGNTAETTTMPAHDRGVHGRPPAHRRHNRGRCRDDLGGELARDRGLRVSRCPTGWCSSRPAPPDQPKADRARRTLRGIDEQVAKAEKAMAGKVPVKRNWFIVRASVPLYVPPVQWYCCVVG